MFDFVLRLIISQCLLLEPSLDFISESHDDVLLAFAWSSYRQRKFPFPPLHSSYALA